MNHDTLSNILHWLAMFVADDKSERVTLNTLGGRIDEDSQTSQVKEEESSHLSNGKYPRLRPKTY